VDSSGGEGADADGDSVDEGVADPLDAEGASADGDSGDGGSADPVDGAADALRSASPERGVFSSVYSATGWMRSTSCAAPHPPQEWSVARLLAPHRAQTQSAPAFASASRVGSVTTGSPSAR
jgi:hypothetical protein